MGLATKTQLLSLLAKLHELAMTVVEVYVQICNGCCLCCKGFKRFETSSLCVHDHQYTVCEQANLREKTKQMKAMASELNMYQAQVNEYKYQIERLNRDLNDIKRKYLEQRRREQLGMERDRSMKPYGLIPAVGTMTPPEGMPKFVGGGFSLSTAAS